MLRRIWRLLVLGGLLLCGLPGGMAGAQGPGPWLTIETGAHEGRVNDASADAAGRLLLTGGHDRTARLWSLPDLRPLTVLRPPVGDDPQQGQIFAVALSPDGRLAAIGGWTGSAGDMGVHIFEAATGRHLQRIGGFADSIGALAFSPQGDRLAIGDFGGVFRLHRIPDGARLWSREDAGGQIYGLSFAPDGRLAMASDGGGGRLRIFGPEGALLREARTELGRRPFRIAFAPDGSRLAIGFDDVGAVEVRDGSSLARISGADMGGERAEWLARVAWSRDGQTLFAGGSSAGPLLLGWDRAGQGARRRLRGQGVDTMSTLVGLPGGRLAVTSLGGDVGVLSGTGQVEMARRPIGQDLLPRRDRLGDVSRLLVASSGDRVAWQAWPGGAWRVFDTRAVRLGLGEAPGPGFADARASVPGLAVTDWADSESPRVNGMAVALRPFERSRSAAAGPGLAVLGTGWSLRRIDSAGRAQWRSPTPSIVWRVNLSSDGRLVVAALGDGTIRWYRARDGAELLALFVTADGARWVAWTPGGHCAASTGGEDLVGWQLNSAAGGTGERFGAGRFRDRFLRPDVIERVLPAADLAIALREADAARREAPSPTRPVTEDLPPVVTILGPEDNHQARGEQVVVRWEARSPSGTPLRRVEARLDDRPVGDPRGFDRPGGAQPLRGEITVPIPPGRTVQLSLLAHTDTRVSEPARIQVHGMPTAVAPPRPRLLVLAIGISAYRDPRLRLNFAAKDAGDIADALRAQQGGLYREVVATVLADQDATERRIRQELGRLSRSATSLDVTIVLFAGHAFREGTRTFFLPVDGDVEDLHATGIGESELQSQLGRIPGKVVALLDFCHAGGMALASNDRQRSLPDERRLLNALAEAGTGVIVFSAATADQPARELASLRNGIFTHAFLDALRGRADRNGDRTLWLGELFGYLPDRVRELSDGRQASAMHPPATLRDFPLALVRP
ncbi:MAG: caspase family protein [Aquidulcibacter sp.]